MMRPADAQRLLGALAGVDAPVGFAVFDAEHRYLAVNAALAERSGKDISDHLGRTPGEVLPDHLAGHTDEMIDRVLRTGESFEADEPPLPGVPKAYQLRSSWYLVDEGRGREVAMFVVDDTSHRRAISSLRHSRARNVRLLEVSDILSRAVTVREVAAAVEEIGKRNVLAHRSAVTLVDAKGNRLLRTGSGGPGAQWPGEAITPEAEVLRTGWPMFIANHDQVVAEFADPAFHAFLARTDERAWAVLPLSGPGGTPIGMVRFAFAREREFNSDACRFLRAVAQQSSLAFSRAQRFEQEHTAAVSLSQGLLPSRLPTVGGLEIEARSKADIGGHSVGGDWYDAFVLSSGVLGLVIGDVMGHGVTAAAGMGQVRAALRALALSDPDPAAVLSGLDRLVERGDSVEMVTVVYALIDPADGTVRISDAGHLPLVRVPRTGPIELMDAGAGTTPIGVSEPRTTQNMRLQPGDVLVAFTDGLVETRTRSLEEGFAQLLSCLEEHRDTPLGQLLDVVVDRMGADGSADDLTVLALRWVGR